MAIDKKESTTSVGVVAPLTDYADGITTYYLAPHFGRSYPVRKDGDIVSNLLDDDFIDPEDPEEPVDPEDPEDPKAPSKNKKAPTLMDIEVISNTIKSDIASNPYAEIVFKVRNSSGEEIKGVNYRMSIS